MTFDSLVLAVVAGMPGPQAWGMLLAGLGICSALAWRQRQREPARVRVGGRHR